MPAWHAVTASVVGGRAMCVHDNDVPSHVKELAVGELIRLRMGQPLDEVPDPRPGTQEQAIINLESARLRRELRTLPALEGKVIRLRYRDELSVRQVARRLNVSVGTAWGIEQRALEMLRASFGVQAAA